MPSFFTSSNLLLYFKSGKDQKLALLDVTLLDLQILQIYTNKYKFPFTVGTGVICTCGKQVWRNHQYFKEDEIRCFRRRKEKKKRRLPFKYPDHTNQLLLHIAMDSRWVKNCSKDALYHVIQQLCWKPKSNQVQNSQYLISFNFNSDWEAKFDTRLASTEATA